MERGREGQREVEGTEIQPRGRGLRPHSVSAQQRQGDQAALSLFTICIPMFPALSSLIFMFTFYFINYTKQTHIKTQSGNGGAMPEIHGKSGSDEFSAHL